VRIARYLAMLLALATLGVTYYFLEQMPYNYALFLPANVAATGALLFWIKAPARKKARWRAALASLFVVPCIAATSALGYLFSPIEMWVTFAALAALALLLAIWAIIRVQRKANHPWADYYSKVN
jgi:hypothetical protein